MDSQIDINSIVNILFFVIMLGIISWVVILNYNKCKTKGEKILFILYVIIFVTPIIIYYMDLWNVPTNMNMTKNVNSQNWLVFLANYSSSIVSAIIGATVSIWLVFLQIRKNNEYTEKRDAEKFRLQNMPLLKFECKNANNETVKRIALDTKVEDGVVQQINLIIKNIGLNTIRKSYMKIKSDILEKEYNFELGNQSSIEKNEEITMQFILKLFVDTTYKFEIVVYYQDLLFNTYEKKVILEYKVLTLNDGNNYFYEHKFITEDEKILEQIPRLDLD